VTATTATSGPGGAERSSGAVEPRRRPGTTTIADRVVEKIASRAVTEVESATGAARTVLGVPLGGTDDHTPARVEATVDGGIVSVRVSMSVRWPRSVREVTTEVREHVTGQVERLTALTVAEVDITVPTLLQAESRQSRVQ